MKYIIILMLSLAIASCATSKNLPQPQNVTLNVREYLDEVVVSKTFKEKYAGRDGLRIVLRVPSGASGVTGEDTKSAFYIDLEKKLVQNGFIVRDRALLDRLLNTPYGDKDYVSIYNKIDTDIILQIDKIDLDERIYPTSYLVNNEVVNDVNNKTFYIRLAEISARVVTVKEGEVGIFAKLYLCATDENGEVKYTVISEQHSTGALGISSNSIKTKIISNTPEDISLLYTELTTKLIKAIKMK